MPERVREEDNCLIYDEYREDVDPRLAENPMAMAMPTLDDVDAAYAALEQNLAPRPADFHTWSREARIAELNKMSMLHAPEDAGVHVLFKVVALSRASYVPRDPRRPEIQAAVLQLGSGKEVVVSPVDGVSAGTGMVIFGPSGVGKSSLVARLKALFKEKLRIHLSLNGQPMRWRQLTLISVVVKRRWKATLQAILTEIDKQTGRGVLRGGTRRGSVESLVLAVQAALSSGFPPVLILDEFQRLGSLKKEAAEEILDGLIDIMEYTGIPIVVVGTVAVAELFKRYAMQMTKFEDANKIEMKPMQQGDDSFTNLVEAYKDMSVSLSDIAYAEDFDRWLHAHTMGIKRFLRFAMKAVLTRHAQDETTVANKELLQSIAMNEMSSCQVALSVLRRHELRFTTTLAEQDAYEHFYRETERGEQTPEDIEAQTRWERKRMNEKVDIFTAEDYLLEKARLSEDGLRYAAEDEAEKSKEAPPHQTMATHELGKKRQAERDKKKPQRMDRVVEFANSLKTNLAPIDADDLPA